MLFKNILLATTMLVSHITLISGTALPSQGTSLAPSDTANTSDTADTRDTFVAEITVDNVPELEDFFKLIEQVPEDIETWPKDEAKAWLKEHFDQSSSPSTGVVARALLAPRQLWLQIIQCAAQIAAGIASGALPVSKVRALVRTLGGARQVARLLSRARNWADLARIGGQELAELGEVLFNARGIVGACLFWV